MKYYLPTIRSDKEGFTNLAILKNALNELNDDILIIDFSRCKFFDANMAASLQAILSTREMKISIRNLKTATENILRKNGFLIQYDYPTLHDSNQTTLPYQCFQFSDRHIFSQYLNQHLSGKGIPRMSAELDKKFRQNIFEVFENCVIHSNSDLGVFVCGQFYPKLSRLDLTIADAGVGIRTNVRQKIQSISSIDAIRWAIQQGNTTKTGSQPGGFGLTLLQEFIEHNRGKIQIASRQGYYEFSNGIKKFEKLNSDFLGTTINLEINTRDNNNYCLRSEASSFEDLF